MTRRPAVPAIRLRGVRHNNLKNFDLDLPLGRLIVITGLSGSGKSSLAFDTLFAEGQRRYIETFSPYARQFFDRMDKPQVDRIDGIPPAIAIEQRNSVKTTRSTVGTMTELCDYMKLLWPHITRLHCRGCDQPVRKEPPAVVWDKVKEEDRKSNDECLVTFDLPLSEKLPLTDSLALVAKQGYQRLFVHGEVIRLEEFALANQKSKITGHLTVVQDRLKLTPSNRARFIEACEQACHFGKGKLTIHSLAPAAAGPSFLIRHSTRFSSHLHCARCDLDYREPAPALFSFNHPVGACPACKGFGRIISIDYDLAIPDRSKTLAGGAVKPWQTGHGAECQRDLMKFCKASAIPVNIPFQKLPQKLQDWVVNGDPEYGKDEEHEWPRAWYGVKGYFRWLESKAYKMHVRVLLSRYRAYTTCPDCAGRRFNADSLLYKFTSPAAKPPTGQPATLTLADFYQLPIDAALNLIGTIAAARPFKPADPIALVLGEVRARLGYLDQVGLGYLTLDRPTRTLSGGETERVNLTTCLGTRLVNTLFVLDEPSVGLHPRDTARLVRILQTLRDAGNTVVVVEHEASVMRAADQIVDLGPGSGEAGGHVVFQGPFKELLHSQNSLTGQYLSGRRQIEIPPPRPVATMNDEVRLSNGRKPAAGSTAPSDVRHPSLLRITNATRHNLKNLTVEIPLHRFVCLTGVSGSGKTTLVREVLLPALEAKFQGTEVRSQKSEDAAEAGDSAPTSDLSGHEHLTRAVLVDQSPLGRTPRSTPVVYLGAFDDLRELFAQTELARQRGLGASAFSFNSAQGQCERCRGAGFEKIEMQFLSDIFIRCPDCNGRRYRAHILDVKLKSGASEWSVADLLEATVNDSIRFLANFSHLPGGRRAWQSLQLLQEVGLGYLRLGQPINTLSGGESQRLKLVSHLAESAAVDKSAVAGGKVSKPESERPSRTLFLFDEPTTGLHFDDVRVLLKVFQRLVDAGHSVLVIEHNLDVIKCADWLIDLGPEAGERGGRVVAAGPPRQVAACAASHTGQALREAGLA